MNKGFKLSGDNDKGIVLKKGNQQIVFKIPIRTKEGVVWCISMQCLDPFTGNEAMKQLLHKLLTISPKHIPFLVTCMKL